MTAILIILFMIECGAFCYLYYLCLEMNKDIDTLYDKYSQELEKITKAQIKIREELRK